MPAQVFGELRSETATHGEQIVYKLLRANLPKEFSVYVECPIHDERMERFPDFIVLTNYGIVVLEVKDWVNIVGVDPHTAEIRTRQNKLRKEKNPVFTARDYAIQLSNNLQREVKAAFPNNHRHIPWGWAAILPNIPSSVKTQLWSAWGEDFVWNKDDLDIPDLLLRKLKRTIHQDHIHSLSKEELRLISSVIFPVVRIEQPDRPVVILDEEQEKIVAEPVKEVDQPKEETKPEAQQMGWLEEIQPVETEKEESLPAEQNLVSNANIRLVRGVAGSGKSLVLVQRAKYLSALHPKWRILVLSFNQLLSQDLRSRMKGFANIKTSTFHSLCLEAMREGGFNMPQTIQDSPEGSLRNMQNGGNLNTPIAQELSIEFLSEEINWIKETGISTREEYLNAQRKGRGDQRRLNPRMRNDIYDLLEAYNEHLHTHQHTCDWADVANLTLNAIQRNEIYPIKYNAILIDEAQDFAPVWLKTIKHFVQNDSLLFMADDPAQSIYRYYSWKERGISVVGHTRRLRTPYRNTYEIYKAAFAIIENDEILQKELEDEGQMVAPDIESTTMKHGERPLIQRFENLEEEVDIVRNRIQGLLQNGVPAQQFAVFVQRNISTVKSMLRGTDVTICSYKEPKGLEFHTVFLLQVQDMFAEDDDNPKRKSVERRLIYMAMTRARQNLYLGYKGKFPQDLKCLTEHIDMI